MQATHCSVKVKIKPSSQFYPSHDQMYIDLHAYEFKQFHV